MVEVEFSYKLSTMGQLQALNRGESAEAKQSVVILLELEDTKRLKVTADPSGKAVVVVSKTFNRTPKASELLDRRRSEIAAAKVRSSVEWLSFFASAISIVPFIAFDLTGSDWNYSKEVFFVAALLFIIMQELNDTLAPTGCEGTYGLDW